MHCKSDQKYYDMLRMRFIRTMAEGEENYRGSELQGWLKVKKRTTGMVNYKDGCD